MRSGVGRLIAVLVAVALMTYPVAARDVAITDIAKKAACVRDGLTKASLETYGSSPVFPLNPTEADIAVAKDRMQRFDIASNRVLRSCLNEEDVRALGYFSFFEDQAKQCPVRRAKSTMARRVGAVDVDIVNAASAWEGTERPVEERIFFKAQAAARATLKAMPASDQSVAACEMLLFGFGPKGDIIPGMMESTTRRSTR